MNTKFYGSIPALITPLHDNGEVNDKQFCEFVEWQINEGTNGLVPMGTTGESPTLSHEEHLHVVDLAIKTAKKRVPIIAGAGSNSTKEAVSLAQNCEKLGADALLVVMPYYNKPSPEGQFLHFQAVAKSVKIPVFIYNIPSRSIMDMSIATMKRLVDDCPNIIGVKDATGDIPRVVDQKLALGDNFLQFSGNDDSSPAFLAMGGHGCISVVANVAPKLNAELQSFWAKGDLANFARVRDKLAPLARALFCENSPAPTKYALSLLGKSGTKVRLPLSQLSDNGKNLVQSAMSHAGLIA